MGLLDFLETPQGQALASGIATYAATAQRGTPWNNIGRGALGGLTGYGNAVQAQRQAQIDAEKAAYNKRQQELLDMHYGTQYMNAVTAQQRAMKDAAERKSSGQALGKAFNQILAPSGMTVAYDDNADEYSFMPVSSPRGVGVTPQGQYTPITKEGIDTATGYDPKLDAPMPGGYRVQLPEKKPYDEKMLKLYSKAYGIEPADMLDLAQTMRDNPEAGKELLNQFSRVYRNNKSNRGTEKDPLAKERASFQAIQEGGQFGEYMKAKDKKEPLVDMRGMVIGSKEVAKDLASNVGNMADASKTRAESGASMVTNSHRILDALDSGKVIAGPTAKARLWLTQLGNVMGFTGDEALSNTRQAIQGLASMTIDARGKLKGQGQVSDYEGKLLEKAASGNIEDMTAAEIRKVVEVNERLGRQMWASHEKLLAKLRDDPAAQASYKYYVPDVEMPKVRSKATTTTPQPSSPNIDELLKKYGGK